ncbi:adipogenesis regulatory factor [Amazona aestiva]|uniref:Adipogenesis regulatory factor n=1 Tax=Amazona aestiva TaxID=12930 RepID=A0A0Q3PUS3_AMAAE|nr:adipogenesis regulatory factor [Amazona aestiva]
MSSKNFQGLKEQAEGAAKDAGNTLGRAAEGAVNQITGASQKAIDRASKAVQNAVEEATEHAAEDISGLGKICGFEK